MAGSTFQTQPMVPMLIYFCA